MINANADSPHEPCRTKSHSRSAQRYCRACLVLAVSALDDGRWRGCIGRDPCRAFLVAQKTPLAPSSAAYESAEGNRSARGEHSLQATTQTSLEFLNSLRGNPLFSENEKSGLTVFLEKTDLLKFARVEAGEREMLDLLDIAARLVRGEAQSEKSVILA